MEAGTLATPVHPDRPPSTPRVTTCVGLPHLHHTTDSLPPTIPCSPTRGIDHQCAPPRPAPPRPDPCTPIARVVVDVVVVVVILQHPRTPHSYITTTTKHSSHAHHHQYYDTRSLGTPSPWVHPHPGYTLTLGTPSPWGHPRCGYTRNPCIHLRPLYTRGARVYTPALPPETFRVHISCHPTAGTYTT